MERSIRLSVNQLRTLIEWAESERYMLVRQPDGSWVRVHPYIPDEEEDPS